MLRSRFLVVLALVAVAACDSSVSDEPMHATATLRVQPVFDGQPLLMGQTYDHLGTNINFVDARVYFSDIALVAEDGSLVHFEAEPATVPAKDADNNDVTHTVSDRIVLAKHDLGIEEYALGQAPVGHYKGIQFKVGIAGLDNRVDATQFAASHPLAKQTDKNNHWSWANGYIYVRIGGQVDSDQDGQPDTAWETHLGKESFLQAIQLNADFHIEEGVDPEIHVMMDYHSLLAQVDLSDPLQRLCHTADNLPVANKVSAGLGGAFMFHGIHEAEVGHGG